MIVLVKLIGVIVALFGLTIFSAPQLSAKIFEFIKEGKRIYAAGVIRVCIGLLLMIAAHHSRIPVASVALGILFLISGIIVFAADLDKLKGILSHYQDLPVLILRLLGLIAVSFGLLIYAVC